jgi:hypothetical protein
VFGTNQPADGGFDPKNLKEVSDDTLAVVRRTP